MTKTALSSELFEVSIESRWVGVVILSLVPGPVCAGMITAHTTPRSNKAMWISHPDLRKQ